VVVCQHVAEVGKLLEYADSIGAEFVCDGHYAHWRRAG